MYFYTYTFIVYENKFMISSQQGSFLFSLIKLAIHQFFNRGRTVGCSILVLAYENERAAELPSDAVSLTGHAKNLKVHKKKKSHLEI